ncbi:MAG: hypothetical protein LBR47_00080 [Spirochaetaceae bacterium]|jgi:hypothetical protein|nr:hypothetical protein [Spirochaetaceae bacterium]
MDVLTGELLVFVLLAPMVLRPFSVKIQGVQSIAVLPVIALICVLLIIAGNGLSVLLLLTAAVSLVFFLSSIPSLYRFISGIPTEWFGPGWKIYAVFLILVLGASAGVVWIYRPEAVPLPADVTELTVPVTGSFQSGFSTARNMGERTSGTVYIWYRAGETVSGTPVLYLPDAGASMAECRVTARLLASEGFVVIGADFNQSRYLEQEISHPAVRSFCFRLSGGLPWFFLPLPEDAIIREKTRELTALAELVESGGLPVPAGDGGGSGPLLLFAEGHAAAAAEAFRLLSPRERSSAFYLVTEGEPGLPESEQTMRIRFGSGGIASWAGLFETVIVEGTPGQLFGFGNIGILQPLDALLLGGKPDREGQQALMAASLAGRYFLRRDMFFRSGSGSE